MNAYTQVLEFFMENGIQLNSNQIEELKEEFLEEKSNIDNYKFNELKRTKDRSVHTSKVAGFTILFMQECDYKVEEEAIKHMAKEDNWISTIDSIIEKEEPGLLDGAKNKSYFVEYYPEDECSHYITFICKNKKDYPERYNKLVTIMIKRLESIKILQF